VNFRTDRRLLISAAALIILAVSVLLVSTSLSLNKEGSALRSQKEEIVLLKEDFVELRKKISAIEGKKSLMKVEGIIPAIDEIFRSTGLNQKVKSVKPIATRDKKYAIEEEADVEVEKVSMNELINILYRLENAPMVLLIKKARLKTSFEDPSLLNVTMTIGLVKPK
jgi:general secretion pathway protein M